MTDTVYVHTRVYLSGHNAIAVVPITRTEAQLFGSKALTIELAKLESGVMRFPFEVYAAPDDGLDALMESLQDAPIVLSNDLGQQHKWGSQRPDQTKLSIWHDGDIVPIVGWSDGADEECVMIPQSIMDAIANGTVTFDEMPVLSVN